ncbi:MAG TPA: proline iminopeptidase-family hydrolase [Prolixibacteraceae bacterium]|nr:proline iminopeptidase-family hydrolase [Prolixibacteraceae bacterium]
MNKEGTIPVEGGNVWYTIVGADRKGIPLMVLHGGPGVPHDYLDPLKALAAQRPVIFYDQLGCGNSEHPSDRSLWTLERFVGELKQVRAFLKLDRMHLLGQSWGAMLAVSYLLREKPEGVLSLILSAPYLSTPPWIQDQQKLIDRLSPESRQNIRTCEAEENYDSPAYQSAMQEFYEKHVCRISPWPDCLKRSIEKIGMDVYLYMWGPSEFTMTGTLKEVDLTEKLRFIGQTVLLTCGEFDEATPETTRLYQQHFQNATLYMFPGASHEHHLEYTQEYLLVVSGFIQEQEQLS